MNGVFSGSCVHDLCGRCNKLRPVVVNALQTMWREWNVSTPDLANNLAGWSSTQSYPCFLGSDGGTPNWRGLQCLEHINCNETADGEETECDGYIIGLYAHRSRVVSCLIQL